MKILDLKVRLQNWPFFWALQNGNKNKTYNKTITDNNDNKNDLIYPGKKMTEGIAKTH